jgi:hypothetical protein
MHMCFNIHLIIAYRKDLDAYRNSGNFPKSNEQMLECYLLLLYLPVVVVVDNKEINDLYSSPNIVRVRWVGNIACMGNRKVYTGFWWGKT